MSEKQNTDMLFITKLSRIIEANLADESFGVNELAHKTGMNRSHLHRKLKSIKNKAVSEFIREIRLEKAKEILQQDEHTVSEIAYMVGFGSPSYFIKCFHDYFGFAPGEYKKYASQINEQNGNTINNTSENISTHLQATKEASGQKGFFLKNKLTAILGILVICTLAFFTYKYIHIKAEKSPSANTTKSIAILPLTNLSDEAKNQHLADGIMHDISNRLSHIHDFEVKPNIYAKAYRSKEVNINKIAKDLKVSYILEGSLLTVGNNIKLFITLFDIKNDKQIWSATYDNDLGNIFPFISDVSRQIADELQAVLSPAEIEQIENIYTKNEKAYNLYLEAKFVSEHRTKESFYNAVMLYNQALAIDSNYCLAYSGLANVYNHMARRGYYPLEDGIAKCKTYAQKALSIDDNLEEAHLQLGRIAMHLEFDWELAEKEFKQALELNPNHADAHLFYAVYLWAVGNAEKAHKHINTAIQLESLSFTTKYQIYSFYLKEGNYPKALEASKEIYRLNNNIRLYSIHNYNIYIRQKKFTNALIEYKNFMIRSVPPQHINESKIDSIYKKAGFNDLIRFHIECEKKQFWIEEHGVEGVNNISIARNYTLLNEKDSTLHYLEKAIDKKQLGISYQIKYNLDFKFLHDDPRFLELLDRMNLGGY